MSQPRVFVAEDEWIVAMDLCNTVAEAGFEVEGPHSDLSSAMLAFQKHKPDIAILDVQLKDGSVYPLAERLTDEDVPIIFHSGLKSSDEVAEKFPGAVTLAKPCPPAEMLAAVNNVLGAE